MNTALEAPTIAARLAEAEQQLASFKAEEQQAWKEFKDKEAEMKPSHDRWYSKSKTVGALEMKVATLKKLQEEGME